MNSKNLLLGTLVGGIVMFLLGYIFYVLLLADFFEQNVGSAQNFAKENPEILYIFIGNLLLALLVTIIYDRWASIKTFATGAKAGAVIGLLMALGFNLIFYATTNIMGSLTPALVDSIVQLISFGITGGVIGMLLGKLDKG